MPPSAIDPLVAPLEALDWVDATIDLRARDRRLIGFDCEPGTEARLRLVFDRQAGDDRARLRYAELDVLGGRRLRRKGPLGGQVHVRRVAAWRADPRRPLDYGAIAHFDRYLFLDSYTFGEDDLSDWTEGPWPPTLRQLIWLVFLKPSDGPSPPEPAIDLIRVQLRARGARLGSLQVPGLDLALESLELGASIELLWDRASASYVAERARFTADGKVGRGMLRTTTRSLDLGRGTVDLEAPALRVRVPRSAGAPEVAGDVGLALWLETTAAESRAAGLPVRLEGTTRVAGRARFGVSIAPALRLRFRQGTLSAELDGRFISPELSLASTELAGIDAQTRMKASVSALAATVGDEERVEAEAHVELACQTLRDLGVRVKADGGRLDAHGRLLQRTSLRVGTAARPARAKLQLRHRGGTASAELESLTGQVQLQGRLGELEVDGPEITARAPSAAIELDVRAEDGGTRGRVGFRLGAKTRLKLPQGDEVRLAARGGQLGFEARLGPVTGLAPPPLLGAEQGDLDIDLAPFRGRFLGHTVNAPAGARVTVQRARLEIQRARYRLFGRVLFDVTPDEGEPILTISR